MTTSQRLAAECNDFDASEYRDVAHANSGMTALLQEAAAHILAQEQALIAARGALNAMLTHMGMDEDDWNKPTFGQARVALTKINEILK